MNGQNWKIKFLYAQQGLQTHQLIHSWRQIVKHSIYLEKHNTLPTNWVILSFLKNWTLVKKHLIWIPDIKTWVPKFSKSLFNFNHCPLRNTKTTSSNIPGSEVSFSIIYKEGHKSRAMNPASVVFIHRSLFRLRTSV